MTAHSEKDGAPSVLRRRMRYNAVLWVI